MPRRLVAATLPMLLFACASSPPAPDRPVMTQAEAEATEARIRSYGTNDCRPTRPVHRPSIDIATVRDRIEERQPGRLTYFGGELVLHPPRRKISLDVKDAQLTSVLRLMAEVARTNLIVGDSVQGKLTLKLSNVDWDRALLAICQTKGLYAEWEGNILHVVPLHESRG